MKYILSGYKHRPKCGNALKIEVDPVHGGLGIYDERSNIGWRYLNMSEVGVVIREGRFELNTFATQICKECAEEFHYNRGAMTKGVCSFCGSSDSRVAMRNPESIAIGG